MRRVHLWVAAALTFLSSSAAVGDVWGEIAIDGNNTFALKRSGDPVTLFPRIQGEAVDSVWSFTLAGGKVNKAFAEDGELRPSKWFPGAQVLRLLDIAVGSDHRIYILGSVVEISSQTYWAPTKTIAENQIFVACIDQNGILDPKFNKTGIRIVARTKNVSDLGSTLGVEPDGNLSVVVRQSNSLQVVETNPTHIYRLLASGETDSDFGEKGIIKFPEHLFPSATDIEINHISFNAEAIFFAGAYQDGSSVTNLLAFKIPKRGKIVSRLDDLPISIGSKLLHSSSSLIASSEFALVALRASNGGLEVRKYDLKTGHFRVVFIDAGIELFGPTVDFRGHAFPHSPYSITVEGVTSDHERVIREIDPMCASRLTYPFTY
jgi:hypothetical protein